MSELEIFNCAGCGGETQVVYATWLPDENGKPYCCQACYDFYVQIADKLEALNK